TTRWAMSYLSGPMTLNQLKAFRPAAEGAAGAAAGMSSSTPAASPASGAAGAGAPTASPSVATQRPMLPPEITQLFAPAVRQADSILYRPSVLGEVVVRYTSAKHDV